MKKDIIRLATFHDLEQIQTKDQAVYVMYDDDIVIPAGAAGTWEKIYDRKMKEKELMVGRLVVAVKAVQ